MNHIVDENRSFTDYDIPSCFKAQKRLKTTVSFNRLCFRAIKVFEGYKSFKWYYM